MHQQSGWTATPSRLIGAPTSIIPTIFMPDALPDTTLPIYPGLGQPPNMLACIPNGLVHTQWLGLTLQRSVPCDEKSKPFKIGQFKTTVIFGRPYHRLCLWHDVSSVCLCLSSLCLSVMFCIVAKRYILAKKCLKE